MANAAYSRTRAGFNAELVSQREDEHEAEHEAPEPAAPEQPAPVKVAVSIDAKFRSRAYAEGYAQGVLQARDSFANGGAGFAFEVALLLDALLGERKHFRERAEARLVGYLEEVERGLDAYFDRGFKMEFAKMEQRELADRLFAAAFATGSSSLPPTSTHAALAVFLEAIADK